VPRNQSASYSRGVRPSASVLEQATCFEAHTHDGAHVACMDMDQHLLNTSINSERANSGEETNRGARAIMFSTSARAREHGAPVLDRARRSGSMCRPTRARSRDADRGGIMPGIFPHPHPNRPVLCLPVHVSAFMTPKATPQPPLCSCTVHRE
jgi:hypothetical protein